MLTTTGLPALRVSSNSRRTSSDPKALPPGESTRSTRALILSLSRALRMSSAVDRPPMLPGPARPSLMLPWATITPTASPSVRGLMRAR